MADSEVRQREVELRYLRNVVANAAAQTEQLLNDVEKVLANVSNAISVYVKTWGCESSPRTKINH